MSDIRLPDYTTAQTELTTASLSVTPAELQGLITGMLSGGLTLEDDSWKTILFDYTNDGMGWPSKAAVLADTIYALSVEELIKADVVLSLLLPDENDLIHYADAVSDWVNHFISGLGLAGSSLAKLSSETKEALSDLEEISKLGIDEDDDLQEQAILLEQVIEHVKVCVLTIHSDLGAKPAIETTTNTSKTLH
ncbi:YecA family protein [Vibrio rumoiensis]|uniref:UPF0149 protein A1QC_14475 n=1 Tax=Vibrio rumoiensis 1S-45 TaxID=1188252 RepID=A0A1E5E4K7_9VIBR|nr:YecA family protein [Vibrio rumoiensis]OEF27770.1 hypothetical protein A1QC_14475 [Vibrio rumoiensis 1S-45]